MLWTATTDWTPPAPLNQRTPRVRFVWGHWLPRLLLALTKRQKPNTTNYAVTLPRIIGRGCDVLVATCGIAGRHLKHEAGGHGHQVELMQAHDGSLRGKASYTATYGWHVILRRGAWAKHMMERGASLYERTSPHVWPGVQWEGLS